MRQLPKTRILILTDRPSLALRWAEMLSSVAGTVWLGRGQLPPDARPDVVVTDTLADSGRWDCCVLCIGGGNTGVGERAPGQLMLPEDVTTRELQIACRFCAEVSHLQQQLDEEATLHQQFRNEAMLDPLTALPNRRAWDDLLVRRFDSHDRGLLCLAILDLDHFKQINDRHGHAVGDEVLRGAARSIAESTRQGDLVARLGGDEFGLVLSTPDSPTAGIVVERVREGVSRWLGERELPAVTASVGYRVVSPGVLTTVEALYSAADAALRLAKQRGRDQSVAG